MSEKIILLDRYILGQNNIGKGSYGEVYLAEDKNDTTMKKAVKKIKLENSSAEATQKVIAEALTLSNLKHINIINYYDSLIKNDALWIITEYCEDGDLRKYINKKKEFKIKINIDDQSKRYSENAINAIKYIHSKNIIHRDIKPENFFIKNNILKLGDFGIAISFNGSLHAYSSFGTLDYRSPELFEENPNYDHKCDIWALGVTVYEIHMLKRPYECIKNLLEPKSNYEQLPDEISKNMKSAIKRMLDKNPRNRTILNFELKICDDEEYEAWNNKRLPLYNIDKNEDALKPYDKAIEINPDNQIAWNNKGLKLFDMGKYEDALKAFDKAIEIQPDYQDAWNGKGTSLCFLLKYEDALKAFDKAIEIHPDYQDAWNNKGLSLCFLNKYEDALKAYDKAIQIKSGYQKAWNNKGNLLKKLGKYEDALKAYDKAIEIQPDNQNAWREKGISLNLIRKYEDALKAFDKAIGIKPDDHIAWREKGNSLNLIGKYEDALKTFDMAIGIKPDDHIAWDGKGTSNYCLGKHEDALKAFDMAIGIKPDDPFAWFEKGNVLDNMGKYEDSLTAYDMAKEIDPDFQIASSQKSLLLLKINK